MLRWIHFTCPSGKEEDLSKDKQTKNFKGPSVTFKQGQESN